MGGANDVVNSAALEIEGCAIWGASDRSLAFQEGDLLQALHGRRLCRLGQPRLLQGQHGDASRRCEEDRGWPGRKGARASREGLSCGLDTLEPHREKEFKQSCASSGT